MVNQRFWNSCNRSLVRIDKVYCDWSSDTGSVQSFVDDWHNQQVPTFLHYPNSLNILLWLATVSKSQISEPGVFIKTKILILLSSVHEYEFYVTKVGSQLIWSCVPISSINKNSHFENLAIKAQKLQLFKLKEITLISALWKNYLTFQQNVNTIFRRKIRKI